MKNFLSPTRSHDIVTIDFQHLGYIEMMLDGIVLHIFEKYNKINADRNLELLSKHDLLSLMEYNQYSEDMITIKLPRENSDCNEDMQLTGNNSGLSEIRLYFYSKKAILQFDYTDDTEYFNQEFANAHIMEYHLFDFSIIIIEDYMKMTINDWFRLLDQWVLELF